MTFAHRNPGSIPILYRIYISTCCVLTDPLFAEMHTIYCTYILLYRYINRYVLVYVWAYYISVFSVYSVYSIYSIFSLDSFCNMYYMLMWYVVCILYMYSIYIYMMCYIDCIFDTYSYIFVIRHMLRIHTILHMVLCYIHHIMMVYMILYLETCEFYFKDVLKIKGDMFHTVYLYLCYMLVSRYVALYIIFFLDVFYVVYQTQILYVL